MGGKRERERERGCRYSRDPKIDPPRTVCGDIRNTVPYISLSLSFHHALITKREREREARRKYTRYKAPFHESIQRVNRPIFFNPEKRGIYFLTDVENGKL